MYLSNLLPYLLTVHELCLSQGWIGIVHVGDAHSGAVGTGTYCIDCAWVCVFGMGGPSSVLYRLLQLLAFTSYSHVFLSVLIYIFVDSVVSALFQCAIRR